MQQALSPVLNKILKATSRAFYLSLAILPARPRRALSLAYLLARGADSIADSPDSPIDVKKNCLDHLLAAINGDAQPFFDSLASVDSAHLGERRLLENFPAILQELEQSEAQERESIVRVVTILISGMMWDQERFQGQESELAGLSSTELEEYTYLVAGCVGPFWSKICAHGDPKLSHLSSVENLEVALEFGKGLQWVNILRDIPKDQTFGRYYLPYINHYEFRQRFMESSYRALAALKSATKYPQLYPLLYCRNKIAVFLPLVLGLRTLEKLYCAGGPKVGVRVKVTRTEVLLWSTFAGIIVSHKKLLGSILNYLYSRTESSLLKLESRLV